ncbi:MAG: hypothetical protein V4534_02580 [Myxococcota bacterium]
MTEAGLRTKIEVSASAIVIGALIGLGYLITLGSLGAALGMSVDLEKFPSNSMLIFIGIVVVLVLIKSFYIAGFIAARISHQKIAFDSLIHSLCSWALMSIILVMMVSMASVTETVRRGVSRFKPPVVVTDIKILQGKAITSMDTPDKKEKDTPTDKHAEALLVLAWWIAFGALGLGAAASASGSMMARKKR